MNPIKIAKKYIGSRVFGNYIFDYQDIERIVTSGEFSQDDLKEIFEKSLMSWGAQLLLIDNFEYETIRKIWGTTGTNYILKTTIKRRATVKLREFLK